MAVPDTNTFTLQNVVDEINPTTNDLVDCFSDADAGAFDPTYEGDKNNLLNFRNYGAVTWSPIDINTTDLPMLSTFYDGTYVYGGSRDYNLIAYSLTSGDTLTLITRESAPVSTYWGFSIYINGAYASNNPIFVADEFYGLFVYTFDGSSFTYIDSDKPATNRAFSSVTGDGTYVYIRDSASIYAYSFNGTTLTLEGSISLAGDAYSKLYYSNGYLYAVTTNGVASYTFDGTNFSLVDTWNGGANYDGVWSNGTYVYTSIPDTGSLVVLSTSGGTLTYETQGSGSITGADRGRGVYGNNDHVFVVFEYSITGTNEGLVAFSADASGVTEVATWVNDGAGQPFGLYATDTYVFFASNGGGMYLFNDPTI